MNKLKYLLLLLALTFPYEKWSSIFLILFFIIQITTFYKNKGFKNISNNDFNFPIVLLFLTTLIFMKLRIPLGNWDRDLSLLLVPISFYGVKITEKDIILILKYYIYLLALLISYALINEYILQYIYKDYLNLWKLNEHYHNNSLLYFIHSISERLDFHHIYLSYFLFFGFISGHQLIQTESLKSKFERILISFLIISFLIFTILSLSRMAIFCFLLYFLFIMLRHFLKQNKRPKLLFVLIILSSVFAFCQLKPFAKKMNNLDKDPRILLFQQAFSVSKEKLFFGYGSKRGGEVFLKKQKLDGAKNIYNNPHNQYLDYLLKGGIFMALSFLIIIYLLLVQYVKNKNKLGLIFIVFFLIQCFTEALLERYRGILFFAIFTTIFYQTKKKKNSI
tara:strand:- start:3558 stop:4733 length:1176 start_codon:yes stop_codon:yes gene_type:complete